MLIEAEASDFALLLAGNAPKSFVLLPDCVIAPPDVLRMLSALAASIRPDFAPCAWMVVEGGEIVGLLSALRPPVDGELHIGYGVSPSRQRCGIASRAVMDLMAWAASDARLDRVTAETAVDNRPSQRVLEGNGFRITGTRDDPQDGHLITWERQV